VSFNKILAVLEVSAIIPKDPPDYGAGLPEKDRPVLASAIALECAALVTGDMTHFGHLYGTSVAGVSIHSPSSIAAHLLVE
jgi:hypothetical protein